MATDGQLLIDTGAPMSVRAPYAFRADCLTRKINSKDIEAQIVPSSRIFAFGTTVLSSKGIAPLWIEENNGNV